LPPSSTKRKRRHRTGSDALDSTRRDELHHRAREGGCTPPSGTPSPHHLPAAAPDSSASGRDKSIAPNFFTRQRIDAARSRSQLFSARHEINTENRRNNFRDLPTFLAAHAKKLNLREFFGSVEKAA
jgi:hypothetical protein